MRVTWLALAVLLLPAASADLVTLKSGKVLEGRVHAIEDGLRLDGPGGSITIAGALVEKFELGLSIEGLVTERFKETPRAADSLYTLGRWFARRGLGRAADRAYQQAIELDPDHLLARRALGQVKQGKRWIEHRELARALGARRVESRPQQPALESPPAGSAARLAWAERRLPVVADAARKASGVEQRARANLARRQVTKSVVELLLRDEEPRRRAEAARILGASAELSGLPSLVKSAVADRSAQVRAAAVAALNRIDDPHAALYFLKPLESKTDQIRWNAVEALGALKGDMSTEVLVKTMMSVYGGGPRVYIFVGNQISYIKDYEVEVAQAAAVADPEIGYVTDGIVLEFKVLRIIEYHTIRETALISKALEKKTGLSLGPQPQKWLAWWRQNRGQRKN